MVVVINYPHQSRESVSPYAGFVFLQFNETFNFIVRNILFSWSMTF